MTDGQTDAPDPSLDSAIDSFFSSIRKKNIPDSELPRTTSFESGSATSSSALVGRLPHLPAENNRYEVIKEVGRGGMGAIMQIWDDHLRRKLAMKVILSDGDKRVATTAPVVSEVRLSRFLEEAQVTGQLDHPGVVPVHELGVDNAGKVYFTMRLVKGDEFKAIIKRVHDESDEEWTLTRALAVLLKVCETMSYAHEKKVIHRDLKPSNVMVGRFGEAYVMDWGLARVLGQDDPRDLRIAPIEDRVISEVRTDRREVAASDTNSPVLTVDGAIIGTPYYMPPEQALGQIEKIGPTSDVYAVGAMLYHLLTNRIPYSQPGARMSPYTVLAMVAQGPPTPVHELAPLVPAELHAICEKAMSRAAEDRYATMNDLKEDLQSYFDGRVVRAYETGAIAEFRKWVKRNRALSLSIGAALLMLLGGLGATAAVKASGEARERLVSDILLLDELNRVPPGLACVPENVEDFEQWQAIAEELRARRTHHRNNRDELALALASSLAPGTRLRLEKKLQRAGSFLTSFDAYFDPGGGAEILARRATYATEIVERTLEGSEAKRRWTEAIDAIAESSLYGFVIEPKMGLLPLGPDPRSGLWEFWHVGSGNEPARDVNDRWIIGEDTGIVFVLIPGGEASLGAQRDDANGRNYDIDFDEVRDLPVHRVDLPPYLVSKYEMTQGQWVCATAENPSYASEWTSSRKLAHPVQKIQWYDAQHVLGGMGLRMPSEAEWEVAARGGTSTVWHTGNAADSLEGFANIADRSAKEDGRSFVRDDEWASWADGGVYHAPVGSYEPNNFGLFDVHGNVAEWCSDVIEEGRDSLCVLRGGTFSWPASPHARVASRLLTYSPRSVNHAFGVRPAADITVIGD